MKKGTIRRVKKGERQKEGESLTFWHSVKKNCPHTSRCRSRTGCEVIFLKAFLKNWVPEEVSRLFWSLSKHFCKDKKHRFLHTTEICGLYYNNLWKLFKWRSKPFKILVHALKNRWRKYPKFRKINNKNVIVQKLWAMEKFWLHIWIQRERLL
jgi:hypothetical protein